MTIHLGADPLRLTQGASEVPSKSTTASDGGLPGRSCVLGVAGWTTAGRGRVQSCWGQSKTDEAAWVVGTRLAAVASTVDTKRASFIETQGLGGDCRKEWAEASVERWGFAR